MFDVLLPNIWVVPSLMRLALLCDLEQQTFVEWWASGLKKLTVL